MAYEEANEFNTLRLMLKSVSAMALPAAEQAAAEVYLRAAQSAAPRRTGRLASSLQIFRGRTRGAMWESGQRMFVGPERKRGYYGYFLEHGWVSVGSRRRQRGTGEIGHSQRGMTGGTWIGRWPWFEPAIEAAESQAMQAAEAAFNAKVQELDRG
jgi:hypothetical protein